MVFFTKKGIVGQAVHHSMVLLLVCQVSAGHGRTYYVNVAKGADNNTGYSPTSAWRTLAAVNTARFQPGDVIAFKSGQRFVGTLLVSSSGSKLYPVTYTTYGGNEPALIDGNGDSAALYAYNKQYIHVKNLAVTNFRKGEITINDLFTGIYIVNEDAGTLHHFHFDKLNVHNVNSTYIARDEGKTDQSRFHGGVQFRTLGNKVRSHFDDVLITNSTFEKLSRTGFNFRSDWDDRSAYSKFGDSIGKGITDNWTPNTNVVFRNNIFRNIAGNGLIVRVATKAVVEHNLFDSCGKIISGNAVFNFNTDSTVYQYNEAKNTVYTAGETDARGIDSDYRTKHTIIQYNYLHDNGQGGIIATGGPGVGTDPVNFNSGTVIRYNIIENNARQGAYFSGRVEGLQVYNNVFYADEKFDSVELLKFNRWTVYPNGASFTNNIFYYKGKGSTYSFTSATTISFSHNLYYGVKPPKEFADVFPVEGDPKLVAAGKGVKGYKIGKGSAAYKNGVAVQGNADADYYGNKIAPDSVLSIGIDNSTRK